MYLHKYLVPIYYLLTNYHSFKIRLMQVRNYLSLEFNMSFIVISHVTPIAGNNGGPTTTLVSFTVAIPTCICLSHTEHPAI